MIDCFFFTVDVIMAGRRLRDFVALLFELCTSSHLYMVR
jgi:hypothetical protein